MVKKITTKREPQTGTGKTLMHKCPNCGKYYLSSLYSHEKIDGKQKYIKRGLFCIGCKHFEALNEE